MVENLIIDYLNNHEDIAFPARGDTPRGGDFCYYLVEKTGSTNRNHIHTAQIAIQSYGMGKVHAASMNENVIGVMLGITALPEISACKLNSDYDFTDTAKKRYRYQAVLTSHIQERVKICLMQATQHPMSLPVSRR